MLKILFNPVTAFAASVGLFLGLKRWLGYPDDSLDALGFLLLFAYGCSVLFLPWFLASPVFRRLRAIKRFEDDLFSYYVLSVPSVFMHTLMLCVLAILFGADHAFMTRLGCTLFAFQFGLATLPLFFRPLEEDIRERLTAFFAPLP